MNYRNILLRGSTILKKNNLANADIDAECLLSYSLNKSRENILLNLNEKVNLTKFKNYISLIYRRRNKEPISHITKKRLIKSAKNLRTPDMVIRLIVLFH